MIPLSLHPDCLFSSDPAQRDFSRELYATIKQLPIVSPHGASVERLETVELPVSSSEIRDTLARGEAPQDLPEAVATYIRANRLYGTQ